MSENFSVQNILQYAEPERLRALEQCCEFWLSTNKNSEDVIQKTIELYCAVENKEADSVTAAHDETLKAALKTFMQIKDSSASDMKIDMIHALSGGGTYSTGGNEDSYRKWTDRNVVNAALDLAKQHPNTPMLYNGTPEQNAAVDCLDQNIIISRAHILHTGDQMKDLGTVLQDQSGPFFRKKNIALVAFEGLFLRLPFYAQKALQTHDVNLFAHPVAGESKTQHKILSTELIRLIQYRQSNDLDAQPFSFSNLS